MDSLSVKWLCGNEFRSYGKFMEVMKFKRRKINKFKETYSDMKTDWLSLNKKI